MYGAAALRRFREQRAKPQEPERQTSILDRVPADTPMDNATITVWNGERFVAWDDWLATAPLVCDTPPENGTPAIPAGAISVAGECGGTRVRLQKDGERWLMYVGANRGVGRRDFATPHLAHGIRTAEQWYGAASRGWQVVKGRDGNSSGTAEIPPECAELLGGHDELDLEIE